MTLASQLLELMGHEAQALVTLKALLVREQSALQERNGTILQEIAAAKRDPMEKLELLAKARARLLASHALPPDASGFEKLLEQLSPQERAAAETQWKAVSQELRDCHKQNQVNGLLLDSSLRSTHEALAILLGSSVRDSNTYDSQGAIRTTLGPRTFVKA